MSLSVLDHIFFESKLNEMLGCPIGKIQLIANYMPILKCWVFSTNLTAEIYVSVEDISNTKDILESLQRLANKITKDKKDKNEGL